MSETSKPGAKIAAARARLGWSQQRLADETGIKQQSIAKIERGQTAQSRYLPRLAAALGVPLEEIDPTLVSQENPPKASAPWRHLYSDKPAERGAHYITVFALRSDGDRQFWDEESPLGLLDRPDILRDSTSGYALYVSVEDMSPAIEPGDIVIVNPRLPLLPGSDCVFLAPEIDDQPQAVEIARYISATTTEWSAVKFNPRSPCALSKSSFPAAHRIAAIYRRQ